MKTTNLFFSVFFLAFSVFASPVMDGSRLYDDFGIVSTKDEDAEKLTGFKISFKVDIPTDVRGVTLHLQSGEGWYSTDLSKYGLDYTKGVDLRLPISEFFTEGKPGAITDATLVRISAWMNTPMMGSIALLASGFAKASDVAIVRATDTAKGEEWFASTILERAQFLLRAGGVDYDVIDDSLDFDEIKGFKTLLLPYSPKLSGRHVAGLKKFLKSGGRILAFYNSSAELASAMDFSIGAYQEIALTAMELTDEIGGKRRIPYFTWSVIPPRPQPNTSAKVGGWLVNTKGTKTSSAAFTLSEKGAWFAHLPPRAYPGAISLIKAIIDKDYSKLPAKEPNIQNLPSDKVVGAWYYSTSPYHKGGWNGAMKEYKELGINTLFIHFASANQIRGITKEEGLANLAKAVKAGRENGIKVHAWVTCFSLDGLPAKTIRDFKNKKLSLNENEKWLNPANTENHNLIISCLSTLVKNGVDGIHLDYVRSPNTSMTSPSVADSITDFVAKASKTVKRINPKIQLSAAVFPTPKGAKKLNQDYPKWVNDGHVDFVTPMLYTQSPNQFGEFLKMCSEVVPLGKIIPGIGTGADESQTDSVTTSAEIDLSKDCLGVAFFSFDEGLAELLRKE